MRGVCGSWLSHLETNFEVVLVDYSAKAISPYRIVTAKLGLVHVPKFWPTYPRIELSNVFDVL